MAWWNAVQHFFGLDSASGTAYLAWSGALSDLGELTLIGGLVAVYRKHNCATRWCFRFGRHDFTDEASGLTHHLCRAHHPAHPGRPLTARHITLIHQRNRGGGGVHED